MTDTADQPLRLATTGCGFFSQFHHQAWQRLCGEFPLVHAGVCDLDPARAAEFAGRYGAAASFTDFESMLREVQPQLVDLVLPPDQHLEHIRIALDHGCDIICQKAFTQNLEEAETAVSLARQAGRRLVVHENFRFQPWHREIRSLIQRGELGPVYQVHFALRPGDGQGPRAYLDRQPYFQDMPRFLVRETGIHFIDTFRFLLGDVKALWADLRRLNPAIAGEDCGIMVLEHEGGQRSVFDGNRLADHAAENRRLTMGEMTVEGERGTLRLDGDGGIRLRRHGENTWQRHDYSWRDEGYAGDCVYALQRHVLAHLMDGTPVENTAEDYLENLRLQELVYRAADQGRRLTVGD